MAKASGGADQVVWRGNLLITLAVNVVVTIFFSCGPLCVATWLRFWGKEGEEGVSDEEWYFSLQREIRVRSIILSYKYVLSCPFWGPTRLAQPRWR